MSNVVNSVIQFGGSTNVLDYVLKHQVAEINPKEVVDFGAGGGKNGKLVRDVLGNTCKLVAVEGFEKTAQMLDENGIYDEVLYMLIQAWIQMNSKCYDLVIFGDVLEHLDLKEINKVINHSLKNFNHIIVVVPLRDIFQDEMYGNPLEIHRTYITSSFFDQYNPIEKHIVILEKYTVMNVHIITRMQKVKLYKRLSSSIFHLIMLFLQPLGLARPLVNFLKRFFHKYKWLLRDQFEYQGDMYMPYGRYEYYPHTKFLQELRWQIFNDLLYSPGQELPEAALLQPLRWQEESEWSRETLIDCPFCHKEGHFSYSSQEPSSKEDQRLDLQVSHIGDA